MTIEDEYRIIREYYTDITNEFNRTNNFDRLAILHGKSLNAELNPAVQFSESKLYDRLTKLKPLVSTQEQCDVYNSLVDNTIKTIQLAEFYYDIYAPLVLAEQELGFSVETNAIQMLRKKEKEVRASLGIPEELLIQFKKTILRTVGN